jgi:pachytene checkpoint protein 2
LKGKHFTYIEVEPHALASAALGKSRQAVPHLLGQVVPEASMVGTLAVFTLDHITSRPDGR